MPLRPHLFLRLLLALLAVLALPAVAPARAAAEPPTPSTGLVVRFHPGTTPSQQVRALRQAGLRQATEQIGAGDRRAALRPGTRAAAALRELRGDARVAAATRELTARVSDFVPNDTGRAATAGIPGAWAERSWNLTGAFGIRAPAAWDLARRAGVPGGRGVTVAVLDTGVAYADRGRYRRSPDLARRRMVHGYDFVGRDRYPNDANGHGTWVATTIAGSANNLYGMPGIAYNARIMPVRVLNARGEGSSSRIAQGIRYAVDHGAQVINVSIELYDPVGERPQSITAAGEIRRALRYAQSHRVTVVAAAGNAAATHVPSRTLESAVIYVGGTTEHGCLGSYSNHGRGLDLVAPGGGSDYDVPGDEDCVPGRRGQNIGQVTFRRGHPARFVVPSGYKGTSMAAPHVTGVVALMLATRVIGVRPTTAAVERRLTRTAQDLGPAGHDRWYGAGLVDAAAALGGGPAPAPDPAPGP